MDDEKQIELTVDQGVPLTTEEHYRDPVLGFGSWVVAACITLLLAFFIRAFIFQSYKIPSESMVPTLEVGDHILVNKFLYGFYLPGAKRPIIAFRRPQRGDVVVFYPQPGAIIDQRNPSNRPDHLIKRIIGIPGDLIQIIDFYAYVNGKPADTGREVIALSDPAVVEEHRGRFGPVKLKDDEYFVMGDNRINSSDSRYFGAIHRKQIEGRAFLIYWSWGEGIKWSRVGRRIE